MKKLCAKGSWMMVCLLGLCILQVILISISNLTLIDKNLDCDTGKLFSHIMCMWQEKTYLIENWSYSTTMELDCVALLAVPLYGLLHNIYLAVAISNILLMFVFMAAVFFLFDGKSFAYPLLTLNFLLVPYTVGMLDYYNMTFFSGGQYEIKIMIPLLLIGLILHFDTPKEGAARKKILCGIAVAAYFLFLFLTSVSSGIYVTACGLVPMMALYVIWKFFKWERMPKTTVALFAGSLFMALLGMVLNARWMDAQARGQSMVFCSIYQWLANIYTCAFGVFELFGAGTYATDQAVLSVDGIGILLKIGFLWVFLICGIFGFRKTLKEKADLRIALLLSISIWNYFILNVIYARAGSATYEYRYHLIGMIPLVCAAAIVLLDGMKTLRKEQAAGAFLALFGALLLLNLYSYHELFAREEQNAGLKELVAYTKDLDVDFVYLYCSSNNADICRTLDTSKPYLYYSESLGTWAYDYYAQYVGGALQPYDVVLAVPESDYDFGDTYTLSGYEIVRIASVGGWSIYIFS